MDHARYTLRELADIVGGECRINGRRDDKAADQIVVEGLSSLANANSAQLAFLANKKYSAQLQNTKAAVVLLSAKFAADSPVPCLVHENPYLSFAKITQLFEHRHKSPEGVASTASVAEGVQVPSTCRIAENAVIMANVELGDAVEVGAGAVIEEGCKIGARTCIAANVTLCREITIGEDVVIHSGATLGSDGFGFARDGAGWQKIAQLGSLIIGDRVDIGANVTIDRGSLEDTVIESDVIIDDQVHIAHNVTVGSGTAIAGCAGIAGSTKIGKNCNIGGLVGIAGHLNIADGTNVLGKATVNRSLNKPGVYASGTAVESAGDWKRNAIRFTQLDELSLRVKRMEKRLSKSADVE